MSAVIKVETKLFCAPAQDTCVQVIVGGHWACAVSITVVNGRYNIKTEDWRVLAVLRETMWVLANKLSIPLEYDELVNLLNDEPWYGLRHIDDESEAAK